MTIHVDDAGIADGHRNQETGKNVGSTYVNAMATVMKRTLIGAIGLTVLLLVGLLTGAISVGIMSGPMGYHDGKDHTEVEVAIFNQVGYQFGDVGRYSSGGWFRPMR